VALLGFPHPVNEKAARTVAAGVLTLTVVTLGLGLAVGHAWFWLTVPLALGFWARVLTGPRLSPLGRLATRVIAPRLGAEKLVAGPPKRFAQGIGAGLTTAAVVLQALGAPTAVAVLLALLVVAAGLESIAGFCLGCRIFGVGMRLGLVPEATCAECADISGRLARTA
jgi:hypothetical protein